VPANAVLALSGDFSPQRAKALITQYFGSIASPPRAPLAPVPPPAITRERRIRIEAALDAGLMHFVWPAPPYFTEDDARLDVVATLLDDRLEASLVGAGIATTVSAREWSSAGGSVFEIWVATSPGHAAAEVVAVVDREIAWASSALGEPELRGPKLRWFARMLSTYDSPLERASRFAEVEADTSDAARITRRPTVYRDATPAQIRATIAATLRPDRRVITEVVPTKGAPPEGRVVGGAP
jgi:predicted Zn-dependent peptidase